MTSTQQWLLIPLIVLGGLVAFAGIWSSVCLLLATLGGYRSLLRFRTADASTGTPLPTPRAVHFGLVGYSGHLVRLTASPEGLGLHVLRLFVGHPDLRVPWDRVEIEGKGLRGVAVALDGRVRLHVPQALASAIDRARPR